MEVPQVLQSCKHKSVNGDRCSRKTLDEHQLCSKHKRYKMYDHLKTKTTKKPIDIQKKKPTPLKKDWVSDKDINKPPKGVKEVKGGREIGVKEKENIVKKVRQIVIETTVDDDSRENKNPRKKLTQPVDENTWIGVDGDLSDPVEEEFEKLLEECIEDQEGEGEVESGRAESGKKATKKVSVDKESNDNVEDEESIQEKKLAALKLKNQVIASHLLKTGYFTLVKVSENFHESLSGLALDLQRDKNVNEVLDELANEYMEELGITEMSPEMRLMLLTGVAIGNKLMASKAVSSSSSSSCQVNVPSTLMEEIDGE